MIKLVRRILALFVKPAELSLGEIIELEDHGVESFKGETAARVSFWKFEGGHGGIRIVLKNNQSFSIAFDQRCSILSLGVYLWYEHQIDWLLGPNWHGAGETVFEGVTDEVLALCEQHLLEELNENARAVPFLVRRLYFSQGLNLIRFLQTEEGKKLRSEYDGTRNIYEHRKGINALYAALNTSI